jgi:hypothetical protein
VNYNLNLQKTVAGNYVNNLDVPQVNLPGNFGVRLIDNMMPTSLSNVYRPRKNTNVSNFVCDHSVWLPPNIKKLPDKFDLHSDDGEILYALKVPKL